ncbi:hypothetical protein [Williamsia sp. D3]|uniref:hypothetical protein n=1 Tax=Williamsia sp. D3 TaxID=1313067 RepID=UPI0003D31F37|nr:hypothetical protein [Williamsia sp. D3]ETD34557.1 membrane protein [Williamsia sp. D3]
MIVAHGLGGSEDLPIPYTSVLIGGAWALTFSFAVVVFAWRTPRFGPDKPGRPAPLWVARFVDSPVTRTVAAVMALVFAVWVMMAGVFGPDADDNPFAGSFYVLLWVGLVVLSVLVGPVWRVISPIRTVYRFGSRVVGRSRSDRTRVYPMTWGYCPAAIGLFAFVWLELASPEPDSVPAIRIWLLCYVVLMVAGAAVWGDRWLTRSDPFDVYSVVASRLSVFGRDRATGRIVVGNPMNHLTTLPILPGTVVLLSVLLGSTAFDSFSDFPQWKDYVESIGGGDVGSSAAHTLALVVFIAVVFGTFTLATRATGGVSSAQRQALPGQLAHTLIPIVIGYVLAHYLQYLVEKGQETFLALGDPLGRGWNVLWLQDAHPGYVLSQHPTVAATLKVGFVLAGHIAAVIAAHDASLRLLPARHQRTGQLALLLTMVAYTFLGLYLLFGG